MQTQSEFVLELDMLEPRMLPTAITPGGRRGKLAAGGAAGPEFACPDRFDPIFERILFPPLL